MKTTVKHGRSFADELVFYTEQWIALLIGIACLAAFVWSAFAGHNEFALRHIAQFGRRAVVSFGWFLTMAVGLLGVALMRFAFYRRDAKTETDPKRMAIIRSKDNARRPQSTVAKKGRT